MLALNLLREALPYRKGAFSEGLTAAGFKVVASIPNPKPQDVLLVWNRYTSFDAEAKRFERAKATVIVAENGFLREGLQGKWFALALNHHAGAGTWNIGGPERWDSFGITLQPWRTDGKELIIFGQRGIGENGIAAPRGWAESVQRQLRGRIRPHPGNEPAKIPLENDLKNAFAAATWSSAAALYALIEGIPLICASSRWIGAQAGIPMSTWLARSGPSQRPTGPNLAVSDGLNRSDADRLAVFRKLAWAQWEIKTISSGEAFRWLLKEMV